LVRFLRFKNKPLFLPIDLSTQDIVKIRGSAEKPGNAFRKNTHFRHHVEEES